MADRQEKSYLIPASNIYKAYRNSKSLVSHTRMHKSLSLSEKYSANIFLKREDLQVIRSFKIRGASNAFSKLTEEERQRGVVTASAGNHAQGIAYCCNHLKIKGTIFMPSITPKLKVKSVIRFGGEYLDLILTGSTFDDAVSQAKKFQQRTNAVFIHAFDNRHVIEGQGGLAAQILDDESITGRIDYVFTCCGGGGLSAGLVSYFHEMSPQIKVIGFEPMGSPSMYNSLKEGKPITLETLDTFVDGASMKRTGVRPFAKFRLYLVEEGLVAMTMISIYNNEAIIVEPAGSLSVAGLELLKDEIVGKTVVCIVSGSNNDISRLNEIRLRSKIYQKKEAYYIIKSLLQINVRMLVESIIDPGEEDIIFITSSKKYNVSAGQCMLGVEFSSPECKTKFQERLQTYNYKFQELKPTDPLMKIMM